MSMSSTANQPLRYQDAGLRLVDEALAANKAMGLSPGSWTELAGMFGISKQAILHWKRVPASDGKVLEMERILGISRYKLRPDVYPDPSRRPSFRVIRRLGTRVNAETRKRA